jgi:hypothetical protein
MTINRIGASQVELVFADGRKILFSYQTPVAMLRPGGLVWVTRTKHSRTTSKHINAALGRWDYGDRMEVDQHYLDTCLETPNRSPV